MTTTTILNLLHLALCLALFASALVRIIHTDTTTQRGIRVAFTVMAMASLLLAAAPWAGEIYPWFGKFETNWPLLIILAAFDFVQFVTLKAWSNGVPDYYRESASEFPLTY